MQNPAACGISSNSILEVSSTTTMGEMNPDYREVLYLTYFEEMSYAQAAEVTGKTVKQITNLVYRGKESLRKLLEREGITNAEP